MGTVEQGLKDSVSKAENHQVLDHFLSFFNYVSIIVLLFVSLYLSNGQYDRALLQRTKPPIEQIIQRRI